jgi:hypothetical protein
MKLDQNMYQGFNILTTVEAGLCIRRGMKNSLEFSPEILNSTTQSKCTVLTKIKTPPGLRSLQSKYN